MKYGELKNNIFQVTALCNRLEDCAAVCFLSDEDVVFISALVTNTFPGGIVPCYTPRPPTLYPSPTAFTEVTARHRGLSERIIENIQDGVYGLDISECYYADTIDKPFILITFPQPVKVSQVVIRSQPSGGILNKFHRFQIRVGNTAPVGNDMSGLTLFGQYDGPLQEADMFLEFSKDPPFEGRYVSMQEMDAGAHLQLCFIEIY